MQSLNPIHLFMLAATASMLIIPPLWRIAPQLGLVDVPDARKVHSIPVPRVGGWGITFGILIPLLLWWRHDALLQSFVGGSFILFAFGVWDDAREIGHWAKFLGQIAAAGLVVYYGGLYVSYCPFLGSELSPAIGKPFTVFALVGVINAVNHSDGLDGLAAGESMLSLIAFAILGYLGSSRLVVGVALAAMGGILGFLRYNSYPARVFMGDCGSQVLGFTLGFLAVYLTQVGDTAVSPALALLVIGMPIADILAVLYQRVSGGMHWFRATRNHIHHRLLDLGFRHYETVIIIYSIQTLLVVSAVLLRYEADFEVVGLYLLVVCVLFGALTAAERTGWRHRIAAPGEESSRLVLTAGRLARARWLRQLPRMLISVAVPCFMLLGSVSVAHVPRDVAIVAALLAAAVATEIGRSRANGSMLVRLAVYVTAISSVYLIINYPGATERTVQIATLAIVTLLAAAISGYVKFASDKTFGTTPTDYLILFLVLALLIFGSIDIDSRTIVEIVVYAVVLLYSCEVLIGVSSKRWNALHLSTLASLTIMALRGAL